MYDLFEIDSPAQAHVVLVNVSVICLSQDLPDIMGVWQTCGLGHMYDYQSTSSLHVLPLKKAHVTVV